MFEKQSKIGLLLFLVGCGILNSFAQRFDASNQLLWQISGKGLKKPSYLFGSFHSNDTRLFSFSDSTYAALLNAEAIVLEADIYSLFTQYDARDESIQLKVDANGNPFTANKSASLTKYGSEDGRPQFLDAYFQQIAYNAGKKFFPLETVESQVDVFENIQYTNFKNLSFNSLSMSPENILQNYISGDLEKMRQSLKSQLAISPNAYTLLITNRNQTMARGIDTLCRKNSLFVAIGAAHLSGSDGVIQLLRNKGYTVRPVLATFAAQPTEAELALRKLNFYHFVDSVYRFEATFGGKPKVDTTSNGYKLVYQEMGQGNAYSIEIIPTPFQQIQSSELTDFFQTENPNSTKTFTLQNGITVYEGITYIDGLGDCWRRFFVHNHFLFKLTCYGGNKFMNSTRYLTFFNRVTVF